MRRLAIIGVIWVLAGIGSAARADILPICGQVNMLLNAHSDGAPAGAVEDPAAAIRTLGDLAAGLQRNLVVHATDDLTRIADLFTERAQLLRAEGAGAAVVHDDLTLLHDDLWRMDDHFGCEVILPESETGVAELGKTEHGIFERLASRFNTESFSILPYIGIALALLLLALLALWRRRFQRSETRHMCNVPLHIVYDELCTITRIIDISRSGIRVEAATNKTVSDDWIEFHFCGMMVRGQVVWRNQYFAGARFEQPLSDEQLAKVLSMNRVSLADAEIEKTAPVCFHPGCHTHCPYHLPTAIALKSARQEKPCPAAKTGQVAGWEKLNAGRAP
ncbi:PilZ domain-containing protein [Pararhodobacter oceanensis]|uniref:PilZ domain-containing protein n=1 Tax=Pararhodobacter oceanensis TaxID=2172121 RepID=UPI003A8E70EC